MPVKPFYTVAQAAKIVGCHPQTYCKKLRIGEKTGVKVYPGEWNGTRWIIKAEVFDAWARRQPGFNEAELEVA